MKVSPWAFPPPGLNQVMVCGPRVHGPLRMWPSQNCACCSRDCARGLAGRRVSAFHASSGSPGELGCMFSEVLFSQKSVLVKGRKSTCSGQNSLYTASVHLSTQRMFSGMLRSMWWPGDYRNECKTIEFSGLSSAEASFRGQSTVSLEIGLGTVLGVGRWS